VQPERSDPMTANLVFPVEKSALTWAAQKVEVLAGPGDP
jgi:hypothetical protein